MAAAYTSTTASMTYNLAGHLLTEGYSGGVLNGVTVTNGYDAFLRRTGVGLNGQSSAAVTYAYDGASRLLRVTNGTDVAHYSYLANSRLVGNVDFKRSGTTRMTTSRTYDKLNRLKEISSTATGSSTRPLRYDYTYNDAGQRMRVMHADGSYWIYQYDALGQVSSGRKYWSDSTPVAGQQFDYAHDDIGNRTETVAGGDSEGGSLRTASYTANNLNQYTSRTVPGAVDVLGIAHGQSSVTVNSTAAYRKGEYFHRAVSVDNVTPAAGAYPSLSSQASRTGYTTETTTGNVFVPKTPEGFTYDDDGNLTFDGRWIYTWDAENRLTQMESYSGAPTTSKRRVQMEYDWKGRRIQRIVSTHNGTGWVVQSTTRYVYDGWNLIAELNSANSVQRVFAWGTDLSGSNQGAGGVGGLLMVRQVASPAGTHYVAYDGNGNVTGLVDASTGAYSAQYEYDPFGQAIRITGTMAKNNPFRFSTKYTDDATDMVYYGYRYYSPSTGRWLSRDPIEEEGGLNLYNLVGNSPISKYDVLGLFNIEQPGRTEAVKGSEAVRDEGQLLIHNLLASRRKRCENASGTVWQSFNVRTAQTVANMYFTGYFLLGQVFVELEAGGIYQVNCCLNTFGKWKIIIKGSFTDDLDEIIPLPGKGWGSLPITFNGSWVEIHYGPK
jgi:RHS repeat-associated protein